MGFRQNPLPEHKFKCAECNSHYAWGKVKFKYKRNDLTGTYDGWYVCPAGHTTPKTTTTTTTN